MSPVSIAGLGPEAVFAITGASVEEEIGGVFVADLVVHFPQATQRDDLRLVIGEIGSNRKPRIRTGAMVTPTVRDEEVRVEVILSW